jgi:hypothetical protein
MSLLSTTIVDKVEVLQDGTLQIREATIVTNNNVEIARSFNRFVRHPGDTLAQSDPSPVPAIANAVWTSEVISAYQASLPTPPTPSQ